MDNTDEVPLKQVYESEFIHLTNGSRWKSRQKARVG